VKRIAILGGGPAGVGAAYRLRREGKAEVVLIERNEILGGNAGSFDWNGHPLDYGSHRLHPACAPEIMADIRSFLGADLLDRPRHGRIRLLGKWVHFPLRPLDLLRHLDRRFALGAASDVLRRTLPRHPTGRESFASVLEAKLGRTICEHFYFPYARKLWGLAPDELSAIQAKKRVSAGSFGKLFRKVLAQVPGFKLPGAGRFYYPRHGYGQICEAYGAEARRLGAEFMTGWTVTALEVPRGESEPWFVSATKDGDRRRIACDHVWSTLPLPSLAAMVMPKPPPAVAAACQDVDYRAMILIYMELSTGRFTEYDAHYFPESAITITRLSEPKNYAARNEPQDRTVLCAELPCARGDRFWTMSDGALGDLVASDLARAGLPLPSPPLAVLTRRLPQAYPIYRTGYDFPFGVLDRWADALPRLLTYGRQGLFAHDNTHHALAMAYAAVSCFNGRSFDKSRWAEYRVAFASHVVED
jgi:protoporphyrinogen oxidase